MDIKFGPQVEDNSSIIDSFVFSNTTNNVLGPLSNSPSSLTSLFLWYGGIIQDNLIDYSVREVIGGTENGYYICISPSSTAPSGGSFSGAANPTIGLLPELVSGESVSINYLI